MVPRTERRTRGWSLTKRLVVALTIGSFFVSLVLGFLGSDRDDRRWAAEMAVAEQELARSLAERAAPLLDRADLMRLSVLTAVVRDQAGGRVLVLDRSGRVVIDSALALGDRKLSLLALSGPFQRVTALGDGSEVRESLAPVRFGGEVIGEVRLQCGPRIPRGGFDFAWFGLVLLSCLTLVAGAAVLGHHWSTRVRGATDSLIRLAAGEVGGDSSAGTESELQDLGSAVRELERGMMDGLQRVGEGYVAMALQLVDSLERRRLVPPGHGERTARLAARIAERLQLLPADRGELDLACRLVDLGKAWIRPTILQKQSPLCENEQQSLQLHPVRAAEQLECIPALRRVAKMLRHQLERYDGRGGPDGLRGERIPLASRIIAIAASFDLLTTCAVERQLEWPEALQQMKRARGEVFDPWLLDLFVEEIEKDPPAANDREVMIVPGGTLPWRQADLDGGDEEDDDRGEAAELEVLIDEPFEDRS